MCRNIKHLFNFEPPATDEEIRASALQYVRKVSGMRKPAQVNQAAFERAVDEITEITRRLLLDELTARGQARDRETERARAAERGAKRGAQLRARLATES